MSQLDDVPSKDEELKDFIDDEAEFSDDDAEFSDADDADEELDDMNADKPESESDGEQEQQEVVDEESIKKRKKLKKKQKLKKLKEFIDDEAELSEDGEFSEDEAESSGDDEKIDTDLVDLNAKELDSEEEEDVRRLYHKQIESEDRRALLLLQEQLEENQIAVGQQRRRKFRWQTKELMENSLRRHYDPDDDDSQGTDDGDDDIDYSDFEPRLKRPTAETLLLASSRFLSASKARYCADDDESSIETLRTYSKNRYDDEPVAGPSHAMSDDSNSNLVTSRLAHGPAKVVTSTKNVDLNKFLFRDKELVEALSTKETVIATREEKERTIQKELKRVLQSKSIFDQLYS